MTFASAREAMRSLRHADPVNLGPTGCRPPFRPPCWPRSTACSFDVASLTKADSETLYGALLRGRQGGWLSPNDCRAETGWPASTDPTADSIEPLRSAGNARQRREQRRASASAAACRRQRQDRGPRSAPGTMTLSATLLHRPDVERVRLRLGTEFIAHVDDLFVAELEQLRLSGSGQTRSRSSLRWSGCTSSISTGAPTACGASRIACSTGCSGCWRISIRPRRSSRS